MVNERDSAEQHLNLAISVRHDFGYSLRITKAGRILPRDLNKPIPESISRTVYGIANRYATPDIADAHIDFEAYASSHPTTKHPIIELPTPEEQKALLFDSQDGPAHVDFVHKLIELMGDENLTAAQRRVAALAALKIGALIARFYELPKLINAVEDPALAILSPHEYEAAKVLRQSTLGFVRELSAEDITAIETELGDDICRTGNMTAADIEVEARLKGLFALYRKVTLDRRSPLDAFAATVSVDDAFVSQNREVEKIHGRTPKDERVEIFATERSFRLQASSKYQPIAGGVDNKYDRIATAKVARLYKAVHFNLRVRLDCLGVTLPLELRINTLDDQTLARLMHPDYKGITFGPVDFGEYFEGDPALAGYVARRNVHFIPPATNNHWMPLSLSST